MNTAAELKVVAISLLLAASLVACEKPGPAERAGKNIDNAVQDANKRLGDASEKAESSLAEERNNAGVVLDDAQITSKIKAAILVEPGLRSLQIGVDTVTGIVTLTGSVDVQANRDRTQALAGAVSGVKEVRNYLVIKALK